MSNVFFTADLHFRHERIISLANRPFKDLTHMDESLIERWNDAVTPEDIVWILGDYSIDGGWREALAYLPRLNGRKRLITGNHDRCWPGKSDGAKFQRFYFDAGFESIDAFGRLKLPPTAPSTPGRKVLLSHFPYAADHTDDPRHSQFRLRDEGSWLIHGHVHEQYTVAQRGVNVGVDRWEFRPVSAQTIAHLIDDVEAGRRPEDG